MSGSDIAVDTNMAISWLNGDLVTGKWLRSFSATYVPVVVLGELYYGNLNSVRVMENLDRLKSFAARCGILDISKSTAEIYGQIRFELRRKGKPIPANDLWISALCLERSLPLATEDGHFAAVEGLRLVRRPK